ncbi:hypothetical protein AB4Z18_14580 [Leifsonia sp. 2TAF2]|uniref:hypothetical protein n=1 Tax=Leifsonia sp. 2TAF2 TaxID=3233009 RepID=UPI003F95260C
MRVRNGATKAALIAAGSALAVIVGITVELTTYSGWGVIASCGIVVVLVLILTRLFRGENESDAPRQWWRMTADPTAGFVLVGWLFVQAIGSASTAMLTGGLTGWVSGIVSLSLAVAYLNSAIRLTAIHSQRN